MRPEVGGRGELSPKPDAFVDLDPEVKGWDPRKDACRIARTLLDSGQTSINIEETMQEWGWEPRRVNPALFYLEQKDGGGFSQAFGRLRTPHVRKTRGTLLFAEEEC